MALLDKINEAAKAVIEREYAGTRAEILRRNEAYENLKKIYHELTAARNARATHVSPPGISDEAKSSLLRVLDDEISRKNNALVEAKNKKQGYARLDIELLLTDDGFLRELWMPISKSDALRIINGSDATGISLTSAEGVYDHIRSVVSAIDADAELITDKTYLRFRTMANYADLASKISRVPSKLDDCNITCHILPSSMILGYAPDLRVIEEVEQSRETTTTMRFTYQLTSSYWYNHELLSLPTKVRESLPDYNVPFDLLTDDPQVEFSNVRIRGSNDTTNPRSGHYVFIGIKDGDSRRSTTIKEWYTRQGLVPGRDDNWVNLELIAESDPTRSGKAVYRLSKAAAPPLITL